MTRTASEIIRNLEMRIARLERQASMRTGASRSGFTFIKNKAKTNLRNYKSLDVVSLQDGEEAIVAEVSDMIHFLNNKAYFKISNKAFPSVMEGEKLYILAGNHTDEKNNFIFVVEESEIKISPSKRIGWKLRG